MILVLAMACALWAVGHVMKAPHSARWTMIGLLYVAVLALHIALPEAHPLRLATGQNAVNWVILGIFAVAIAVYRRWLRGMRNRATTEEAKRSGGDVEELAPGKLSETELNRYARHIVLREIGGGGQTALKKARVLVIGAGGLGAPALQYLGAAGVGTIGIIDDDRVENANLQRQVIHTDDRIGMPKVFSAQQAIEAQNPYAKVLPYNRHLTEEIARDLFDEFDVVLDGTDNFETRYLANRVAAEVGIPLISGALSQWEGQISVFAPARGTPCYQCVFPSAPAPELAPSCAEAGVLGPLPGVVGAMMAVEAIKLVTGAGTPLLGQMLIYDALYGESRTITLQKDPQCPVCGASATKSVTNSTGGLAPKSQPIT
ncbi:MAG: molybdopterin-synthase adenylyltransferase MoeB [Rhodobacteraceae bacterium]|nr:molybdopterin-synthase adenylyltransferase MoeB [Paracoccaceae bacterium]